MAFISRIQGTYASPAAAMLPAPVDETISRVGEIFRGRFDLNIPPIPAYTRKVPYKWDDDNFLKRVPESERNAIRTVIRRELSKPQSEIHDVTKALTINSKIGYRQKTAQVLHHYLESHIQDPFPVARLLMYDACRKYVDEEPEESVSTAPVRTHALVGERSEQSFELLRKGYPYFLDEEHWELLKTAIRDNPDEPWDFFTITYPAKRCLDQVIASKAGLIYRFRYDNHRIGFIPHIDPRPDTALSSPMTVLMIPPRLWDHMMQVRFGQQRMRMNLGVGYSPIEILSNPQSRQVEIPCVFVKTPDYLHEIIYADLLAGCKHDMEYHILIESANPHRELWIKIAKLFKDPDVKKFEELLDREFLGYAYGAFHSEDFERKIGPGNHYSLLPDQCFWATLADKIDPEQYPNLVSPILDLIRNEHPSLMNNAINRVVQSFFFLPVEACSSINQWKLIIAREKEAEEGSPPQSSQAQRV